MSVHSNGLNCNYNSRVFSDSEVFHMLDIVPNSLLAFHLTIIIILQLLILYSSIYRQGLKFRDEKEIFRGHSIRIWGWDLNTGLWFSRPLITGLYLSVNICASSFQLSWWRSVLQPKLQPIYHLTPTYLGAQCEPGWASVCAFQVWDDLHGTPSAGLEALKDSYMDTPAVQSHWGA